MCVKTMKGNVAFKIEAFIDLLRSFNEQDLVMEIEERSLLCNYRVKLFELEIENEE